MADGSWPEAGSSGSPLSSLISPLSPMTAIELLKSLTTLLKGDRDGDDAIVGSRIPGRLSEQGAWPTGTRVRRDPNICFLDEVTAPEVRICLDAGGATREQLTNGGITKISHVINVGLFRRVENESEFDEAQEWVSYVFDLFKAVRSIGNWTHNLPGEWQYLYDERSLSTQANGTEGITVVGPFYSLFTLTWSTTE